MQYKIPQNVGIEDKIVGPLTLRQLIFLAVGFGISYVLFAILNKLYELNILEYIIIAIPALVAAALALIRINDVSLTKFVFLFLEFAIKPKQRMWDHRGIAATVSPDLSGGVTEFTEIAEKPLEEKAKKAANLKELTRVLDSGGFEHLEKTEHEDIDSVQDDNLVTHAYFGHKESDTDNMYWRTTEAHKEMLTHIAKTSKPTPKPKPAAKKAVKPVAPPVQTAPAKEPKLAKPLEVKKANPAKPSTKKSIDKSATKKPNKKPVSKPKKSSGEFKFEELKKGEIEINLD